MDEQRLLQTVKSNKMQVNNMFTVKTKWQSKPHGHRLGVGASWQRAKWDRACLCHSTRRGYQCADSPSIACSMGTWGKWKISFVPRSTPVRDDVVPSRASGLRDRAVTVNQLDYMSLHTKKIENKIIVLEKKTENNIYVKCLASFEISILILHGKFNNNNKHQFFAIKICRLQVNWAENVFIIICLSMIFVWKKKMQIE